MPEGIGYPKGVTAEQRASRKGCVETLIEQGLSKEEAVKRCGALKPIDKTPRVKAVEVDLNARKSYFPRGG